MNRACIHEDIPKARRKILGLACLFQRASTDQSGPLDLDEPFCGIGDILNECAEELDCVARALDANSIRQQSLLHFCKPLIAFKIRSILSAWSCCEDRFFITSPCR